MILIRKNRTIELGIWCFTAVVLLSVWGFAGVFFKIYKKDVLAGKQQALMQTNTDVTQHAEGLFKAVAVNLNTIDLWLLGFGNARDPLRDPIFVELVSRFREIGDALVYPILIKEDGDAYVVSSSASVRFFANLQDREYYRAAVQGPAGQVVIGTPVVARDAGKWVMPIAQKLSANTRSLNVVVGAVNIDRFLQQEESWDLGKYGSVILLRGDGTVLTRIPKDEKLLGRKFDGSLLFAEGRAKERGVFISDSRVTDGIKRLVSYEYVKEFDVFVIVTRGYEESLESFYGVRFYAYLCIGILSLFILATAVAISRAQRAMQKAQQHYQRIALVDDLTTVLNRRAFMSRAEDALEMAKSLDGRLAVLMLDIDYFKRINDSFGHASGDEALRVAASLWRGILRKQDILGRLGGEEFSIILPGAELSFAVEVAERLRALTEKQSSIGPGQCVFTVSIGLAVLTEEQESLRCLLQQADEALYLAKRNGRNRVEVWDGPTESS